MVVRCTIRLREILPKNIKEIGIKNRIINSQRPIIPKITINVPADEIPDGKAWEEVRIKGTDQNGEEYNSVGLQRTVDFTTAITDSDIFNA